MRILLLALAFLCAACSRDATGPGGTAGGYKLEVRAAEAEQIYLVTSPQGRVVAARASAGDSALLDAGEIRALESAPETTTSTASTTTTTTSGGHDGNVSIHAPGVSIEAHGDDDSDKGDAHISLNWGGHGMQIDAHDNGGDSDHAHVVITGADAKSARSFVMDAEHLSPEVRQQMLAQLGLSDPAK